MEKLRNLLQDNLSAQYTNIAASQWLSIRLRLMAVVMVTAIAFTAVFENKIMSVESGLIGLSITYALTMTNVFNSLLSSMIDTEKELVSVERIMDYVETIPSEETDKEAELVDRFLVSVLRLIITVVSVLSNSQRTDRLCRCLSPLCLQSSSCFASSYISCGCWKTSCHNWKNRSGKDEYIPGN